MTYKKIPRWQYDLDCMGITIYTPIPQPESKFKPKPIIKSEAKTEKITAIDSYVYYQRVGNLGPGAYYYVYRKYNGQKAKIQSNGLVTTNGKKIIRNKGFRDVTKKQKWYKQWGFEERLMNDLNKGLVRPYYLNSNILDD